MHNTSSSGDLLSVLFCLTVYCVIFFILLIWSVNFKKGLGFFNNFLENVKLGERIVINIYIPVGFPGTCNYQ